MKKLPLIAPVIALLLAEGCQTTQPPPVEQSERSSSSLPSHSFSGMEFPLAVGEFRQGEVERYDRDGRDMSVAYNLPRLGSAVAGTVYVYPAPVDVAVLPIPRAGEAPDGLVKNHTEEIKAQILRLHQKAQIVTEDDVVVRQTSGTEKGRKLVFQYTQDTPYGPQPFLSEMLLFTHRKWFIKYRFTYLLDYQSVVRTDIDHFVEALAWPQ